MLGAILLVISLMTVAVIARPAEVAYPETRGRVECALAVDSVRDIQVSAGGVVTVTMSATKEAMVPWQGVGGAEAAGRNIASQVFTAAPEVERVQVFDANRQSVGVYTP